MNLMEVLQFLFRALFDVSNIWSVVFKGVVWFVVAFIIIAATDNPNPEKSITNLKSSLGFFIMFLLLSGSLLYLLFGQTFV